MTMNAGTALAELGARTGFALCALWRTAHMFIVQKETGKVVSVTVDTTGIINPTAFDKFSVADLPPILDLIGDEKMDWVNALKVASLPDVRKTLQAADYRMHRKRRDSEDFCNKIKSGVASLMALHIAVYCLIRNEALPTFDDYSLNAKSRFTSVYYNCRNWLHSLLRWSKSALYGRSTGADTRSIDFERVNYNEALVNEWTAKFVSRNLKPIQFSAGPSFVTDVATENGIEIPESGTPMTNEIPTL